MICFNEELEGGNNPLEMNEEEFSDFVSKVKLALHENLKKEEEKEEESRRLTEKYIDCTPIYKYACIFANGIPLAQIQFLYSYEENDIIRKDIGSKAAQILMDYSEECPKGMGENYFEMTFELQDEKFEGVKEIFVN